MWRKYVVLDSGAGPNCIAKAAITPGSERFIAPPPRIRVRGAGGDALGISGQVTLAICLGDTLINVPFLVCDTLQAEALLGTEFIDAHVRNICCEDKFVELKTGTEVPILRTSQASPPDADATANRRKNKKNGHTNQKFETQGASSSNKIRVARSKLLQPHTQTWVTVQTERKGAIIIEPRSSLSHNQAVATSNGVAHVRPHVPFRVLVANFGDRAVRLHKGQIIAHAFAHPAYTAETDISLAEVLNVNEDHLNDVQPPPMKMTTAPAEQDTSILTDLKKSKDVNDIPLDEVKEKHHAKIRAMLRKHESMWSGHLGAIKATEHRIELSQGAQPVRQAPYRSGLKQRDYAKSEIDKMLKAGVIEPSNSEWASPIVLAPKPGGGLRFCVDYRRLNTVTKRDSYPIPRMDDCTDSLGQAKVFTTLDANWGFWQLPLRNEDREKTAFCSFDGLYQFTRMPFGLTNAPASFQRALDVILARYKWKTCLVYIDDVIIFSSSVEDHISHVDTVLTALKRAGVSLKIYKCDFFTQKVKYLGHIVRPGTIEIDHAKTKSLRELRPPETLTQLKFFLGFVNVYRRFIPNYTKMAQPLYELQKGLTGPGKQPLPPLQAEHFDAFHKLISAVLSPEILAIPHPGLKFSLDTDASDYQIGCVLFQTNEAGQRKPVGFWSRTLNPAERNYSVPEKECLAVVYGVTVCRPYLFGEQFDVHTDHNCLQWLMMLSDPSGRLLRWRLRLSDFTFEIHYKKGYLNTQADALSRLLSSGHTTEHEEVEPPCFLVDYTSQMTDDEALVDDYAEEVSFPFEEVHASWLDVFAIANANEDALPTPITEEEMLRSQHTDDFCIETLEELEEKGERGGFVLIPKLGSSNGDCRRNRYMYPWFLSRYKHECCIWVITQRYLVIQAAARCIKLCAAASTGQVWPSVVIQLCALAQRALANA